MVSSGGETVLHTAARAGQVWLMIVDNYHLSGKSDSARRRLFHRSFNHHHKLTVSAAHQKLTLLVIFVNCNDKEIKTLRKDEQAGNPTTESSRVLRFSRPTFPEIILYFLSHSVISSPVVHYPTAV